MADTSVWIKSVPLVKDGDPVRASVTNAPTQVLADRTEALRAMMTAVQAGQQLMLRDAPLGASIDAGTVVYFDAAGLVHQKAAALWMSLQNPTMELFPAPSAIYMGVVVNKTADRVGDILVSGFATLDPASVLALFGTTTPALGQYFLSMTTPGVVQTPAPLMVVRVLEYMGSGLIRVFPPSSEPVTHTHRNYRLLADTWLAAASFDPSLVPPGAQFGYDLTAPDAVVQNLTQAILPTFGVPTFVWLYHPEEGSSSSVGSASPFGGLHVDELWPLITETGIWWMSSSPPPADIEMTVTSADAKGAAILNAIRSMTPETIRIVTANGLVSVYFNEFAEVPGTAGSTFVKDIIGNRKYRGPGVEKVVAGRNVVITPSSGQGSPVIEFLANNNELLEATVQNLNNAITTVEDPHVLTMFPVSRTSQVACRVLIPNLGTAAYQMRIFAAFMSPLPSQAGPTGEVTLVPTIIPAGVTPGGPTAFVFPAFPGTVVAGNVYYVESTVAFPLTGYSRGVVSFTLTAVNPVKEFRMLTAGIRLYL